MKIKDYTVCVLISISLTLLAMYPRISENKVAWETQMRINELIIEVIDAQAETNDSILGYLKTISKKSGQ